MSAPTKNSVKNQEAGRVDRLGAALAERERGKARGLADPARLAALARVPLMDTAPEPAFDRLTRLASRLLRAPVALISLVDDRRQFFKSQYGLPETGASGRETPLTYSFCRYVAETGDALVVPNAALHPAGQDNRAVPDIGVAAYLGMPLTTSDCFTLGALCVMDITPRPWSVDDENALRDLAAAVVTEIELRRALLDSEAQTVLARKKQNEAVETAKFVERIANAAPLIIYVYDLAEQRNRFCNREIARVLGYSASEVQAMGSGVMPALLHPDDGARHPERTARLLTLPDDAFDESEFRVRHASGEWRTLHTRVTVFTRDETGKPTQILGFAEDITERVAESKALRESEAKFRAVVEGLSEGLLITDGNDVILYASPRLSQMTGYTLEEMLGRPGYELFLPPSEWDKMRAHNTERMSGQAANYETEILRKDRSRFWAEIHATPFRDAHTGEIVGTLSTNTDITLRKEQDERLRALALALRRSNQSLQDFASVASHDLQEPLRKILMFGGRLEAKAGDALPSDARDYLHRMLSASNRMQDLLNDLLAYSRVTSRAQPFRKADLGEIAQAILADMEGRLRGANVTVEMSTGMPVVDGDPHQLRQLLQNLLGNAIKFRRTDADAAPPVIGLNARVDEERCVLTVSDNGIGFEASHAERIFEVFERLHARSDFEGTGMGLAICRRIAERHRGTIVAQSAGENQGAVFTVTLPLTQNENPRIQ